MEGMLAQRVSPLLKCVVLFLFIFTAKVLTSRPQESHETRNDIHAIKPLHYVRTFTKYHHRRTIQKNNQDLSYWPVTNEHGKYMGKRSIDDEEIFVDDDLYNWPAETKFISKRSIDTQLKDIQNRNADILDSKEFISDELPETKLSDGIGENEVDFEKKVINGKDNGSKNGVLNEVKKYKVKAAMIFTEAPTTLGPTISCLYKMQSVSKSLTPSYEDDTNVFFVENKHFAEGPVSEITLLSGEIVQVEQCQSTRAACYTLWHQDQQGNITVLGQGCWHSSRAESHGQCYGCMKVNGKPVTNFCCCSTNNCNADFITLKDVPIASFNEETVTMKAKSSMTAYRSSYPSMIASGLVVIVGALVMAALVRKLYCQRLDTDTHDEDTTEEKGEVMGTGPDALATGLLCVDNLTLIEHIGQGKFGSVWRGSLGSTPVAVKLYSNSSTWQKEAAIYALPHLAHPNILKYYGSDARPGMAGCGRSQLIVVELCCEPLRRRLQRAPLLWPQLATLAHGLAAALAHLHTPSGSKPCVVHRDVNSNNVLVTAGGEARLADLGLAQAVRPRGDGAPSRITEGGTLRYLAPEALEGAVDLSGARAALCSLDVFALGLVLWELLWRTRAAHAGPPPPYAPPYSHHGLPDNPTLAQMQSLVSRNKARPPLPKGPVPEARALKLVTDTCDECWDHDAEARLTAVCVEERMAELKQMVMVTAPLIHDNQLHPHTQPPDTSAPSPSDLDKNSNCTVSQKCDVTTPLLYPYPHIGRNACIERNTNTHQHTVELIHKSLKDISAPETTRVANFDDNCLSVARNTRTRQIQENSLNEIRSYQRPLEYVQNDVSNDDRGPKQTNLLHDIKVEKPKWGIRKLLQKFNRNKMETEVKLVPESMNGKAQISIVNEKQLNVPFERPNLVLNQEIYNFEGPCTLSPPNKTLSPTMMTEQMFKELPNRDTESAPNQIFAVIVPKVRPTEVNTEMRNKTSRGSSESINKQSVGNSMSSQSIFKSGHSESEDSTVKKRLSCDNRIITNTNSGRSSRASINLELQYIDNPENFTPVSPFELNSDCSSSEDEHLMLLSENGGSKITMQTIPKLENEKKKFQKEVLREASQAKTDFGFNKNQNKYTNLDNELSDPHDKENLVNVYSGDNPVYFAALNGEINTAELKIPIQDGGERSPKSPKPSLKSLSIKRQHSLEQVSEIFSSSGDVNLLNPAGRVKTPGDLPVAIRRARRDRALQRGRANEGNRLSLYDDRMMFGNSL